MEKRNSIEKFDKMRKYKYILFDLDGTLIFSHLGIIDGMRYALKQIGKDEKDFTDDFIKGSIGPPKMEAFKKYFHLIETEAIKATDIYYSWYLENGVEKCYLVDNVLPTVKFLKEKNYILGVVTLKPQIFAEKILYNLGILKYFTILVGASLLNKNNKKYELIEQALDSLNAEPNECLFVGDTKEDIESAKILQIEPVLFLQGYAPEQEKRYLSVGYTLENFLELIPLLDME